MIFEKIVFIFIFIFLLTMAMDSDFRLIIHCNDIGEIISSNLHRQLLRFSDLGLCDAEIW
jgi:hypothetical protein